MLCPKCKNKMVENNKFPKIIDDNIYFQVYFCFDCRTLFECSSQSEDMIEENLEELGEI